MLGDGSVKMAHHYNSDCKQCYRYQSCLKSQEEISLSNEDLEQLFTSGQPLRQFHPRIRKIYQGWWKTHGMPIGMGNHDCFKSPEEHVRDLENNEGAK